MDGANKRINAGLVVIRRSANKIPRIRRKCSFNMESDTGRVVGKKGPKHEAGMQEESGRGMKEGVKRLSGMGFNGRPVAIKTFIKR